MCFRLFSWVVVAWFGLVWVCFMIVRCGAMELRFLFVLERGWWRVGVGLMGVFCFSLAYLVWIGIWYLSLGVVHSLICCFCVLFKYCCLLFGGWGVI